MNDNELYWLAGVLEGEGSFMMISNHVGGKVYRYPKIVVNMTDRDIIERVASLFGTSVYDMPPQSGVGRENYKRQFRAQTSGTRGAEMMLRLRPIMGNRRQQRIDEVLSEYGDIEPTEVRRKRSNSEGAKRMWANRKAALATDASTERDTDNE